MATAAEIADLLTQGIQGPTGADDSGWHVGTILSWDSANGLNSVLVNNSTLTNLKALAPSIGTEYAPGQNVLIVRKQTQYFILGPVQVPGSIGSTPPTQVDTNGGAISGATDVWRDLDAGAGASPTMTVKLGPLQRCLFMWGMGFASAQRMELSQSLVVTSPGGGNSVATPGSFNFQYLTFGQGANSNGDVVSEGAPMKTALIQANRADSPAAGSLMLPGVNTVALKYRIHVTTTGTSSAFAGRPWLLAIPF